jgi:hypothetical protein
MFEASERRTGARRVPDLTLVLEGFHRMRFRLFPAVTAIVVVAACGGSDGGPSSVRTVAKVTVSAGTSVTTLNPGQTLQLTATAVDASGATIANPGLVIWASSATTVATVDQSGKVTAVGAGTTNITADAGGVKGTLSIKVNLAGTASKAGSELPLP